MSPGELEYLLQRLLGLINLHESMTIIAWLMIANGASPLILKEARAALWLQAKNYARTRTLRTFVWLPIGLALLYIL